MVVLVDDDEAGRRALRRVLDRPGVIVNEFATAEEAVRFLGAVIADLLITDFDLPGMNGAALITAARTAGHRCPMVIITGRLREDTADRLLALGVPDVDIITKPLGLQDVRSLAARYLART